MSSITECAAFLVEPQNNNSIQELAQRAGFSHIFRFSSLAQVEQQTRQTPICFFLFGQIDDFSKLSEILHPIRICKRHNVRFFPIIHFCNNPSPEIIKQYIVNGFDDIITGLVDDKSINKRLNKHLNNMMIYYETAQFFGPDRRRIVENEQIKKAPARGVEKCVQYSFIRDPKIGVKIVNKVIEAA